MNIAVSACLLGHKVRFDGGHKRDSFIDDELSRYAQFVPFCPEAVAFPTPRESIRLVNKKDDTQIVQANKSLKDVTSELDVAVQSELKMIKTHKLSGIIFKSRSPSCGFGSAKTYLENGFSDGKDDGVFVQACKKAYPLLPMEEESRLINNWLRENFIMQLFAYDAFENFKDSNIAMKDLVDFHTKYKFLLQAKDEKIYRELGNIVGNAQNLDFSELIQKYELLFKTAIAKKSSIKRNRNVLEHMAGFFKNDITSDEKKLLHEQIDDYALKIVPIITPLSTLYMYAKKYDTKYLLNQVFLNPYPKELALRSHLDGAK